MSLPALPQLQQVFGAGVSSAQLTLSVFLLGFALAGLACAASTSLTMLVACRFRQGAAVWFGVGGLAGVFVPMTVYMFGQGLVMPNATAAAMAPHGRAAGVVSSVMGFLQTGGAALSGYLVGLFYDRTPLSLALTVAAFGCLTLLASAPAVLRGAREGEG
jgi:Na+/melibiose symporter-like transporter